jgi:hypothetical protein
VAVSLCNAGPFHQSLTSTGGNATYFNTTGRWACAGFHRHAARQVVRNARGPCVGNLERRPHLTQGGNDIDAIFPKIYRFTVLLRQSRPLRQLQASGSPSASSTQLGRPRQGEMSALPGGRGLS